ncbi:hypothetical protein BHM03_00045289 [Ensete ventricosum]|nr:hypothetical protein BHM03_00045289 [Ensete ventricosum]
MSNDSLYLFLLSNCSLSSTSKSLSMTSGASASSSPTGPLRLSYFSAEVSFCTTIFLVHHHCRISSNEQRHLPYRICSRRWLHLLVGTVPPATSVVLFSLSRELVRATAHRLSVLLSLPFLAAAATLVYSLSHPKRRRCCLLYPLSQPLLASLLHRCPLPLPSPCEAHSFFIVAKPSSAFSLTLALGTPPQQLSLLDTRSHLTWVSCTSSYQCRSYSSLSAGSCHPLPPEVFILHSPRRLPQPPLSVDPSPGPPLPLPLLQLHLRRWLPYRPLPSLRPHLWLRLHYRSPHGSNRIFELSSSRIECSFSTRLPLPSKSTVIRSSPWLTTQQPPFQPG